MRYIKYLIKYPKINTIQIHQVFFLVWKPCSGNIMFSQSFLNVSPKKICNVLYLFQNDIPGQKTLRIQRVFQTFYTKSYVIYTNIYKNHSANYITFGVKCLENPLNTQSFPSRNIILEQI